MKDKPFEDVLLEPEIYDELYLNFMDIAGDYELFCFEQLISLGRSNLAAIYMYAVIFKL